MIKLFIFIVSVLFLLLIFSLLVNNPGVGGKYWLLLFAVFVLIEKLWETFFTSKQKDVRKYQGDWTLMLTSIFYAISALLAVIEFFYITKNINIIVLSFGLLIYILAGLLRFWSIKTLGKQWNIHLIEESEKSEIIVKGPYKYIRHPIYLGHFLELVGIALTFNALYSLIFIFVVNLPLYIQRAFYEEKINAKKFGEEYQRYKKETSFMVPIKLFKIDKDIKKG